jgi:methylmalonyl-CoA mutase
VQYLQVRAFNELQGITPIAERLARNTQLILKEETFLQNIVDPAGGSWYIESLTNELVEKAWSYFLTIEEKGGLMQVLESNWLQSEIGAILTKRRNDTFTRKQSIVGTNVYANLQEVSKEVLCENEVEFFNLKESLKMMIQDRKDSKLINLSANHIENYTIKPVKSERLSKPFEELRQRAGELVSNKVGLICLGELKDYKARADFMSGFLTSGGLEGVRSNGLDSVTDALAFMEEIKVKHYVLCSSNEIYSYIGLQILSTLKEKHPEVSFYVAGLLENDVQKQWFEAGTREFVHLKTNCFEFNTSIIHEQEEVDQRE